MFNLFEDHDVTDREHEAAHKHNRKMRDTLTDMNSSTMSRHNKSYSQLDDGASEYSNLMNKRTRFSGGEGSDKES